MTGIVLIGGKSKRFGSDKVLTTMGHKPLIEHVVDLIRPLFDEIILVGHAREGLEKYRVEEDIVPGCGPLCGIFTALCVAGKDSCFVFAADMPNLNRDFISFMISELDNHDIVIPVWSKGREPLHAIYHTRIIPVVASLLDQKDFKIFSLIEKTDTLFITEDTIRTFGDPLKMFANINTPDDLDLMTPFPSPRI
jgi:molybdopterin-guanine dinucleotide biosynthesis protein A